ncbi:MAG: HAD family hydrolase [Opitutaceae bacterium]|nr:HAD family hydrolase [Opitutaceae bacterium]
MNLPAWRSPALSSLRLAAIDLDGTLLGTDHQIGDANRAAVGKLMQAGLEVVLASGRHHHAMSNFARELPGVRWLISAQGGEVSDVDRTQVLEQRFLARAQVSAAIAALNRQGMSALFYAEDGILTDSPLNDALEFYQTLSGNVLHRVSTPALLEQPIFKVVAASSETGIDQFIAGEEIAGLDLQRVRSHRRFYEFMPHGVTKASGLKTLTAHLGLNAAQVIAFGDGDNDVPMFQWAGHSVAMPHGWPDAKTAARLVAPEGDPDTAFARAVDCLLG